MDELEKIFKAVSDKNRIRILKMLEIRPLCVCEITDALELAGSTVSKHLSVLKNAGFISSEKKGRRVDYKLSDRSESLQVRQILSLFPMWLNDEETVLTDSKYVIKSGKDFVYQLI